MDERDNTSTSSERSPKPTASFDPTHIPEALHARNQWVCWRYEWKDDKWTKVPLMASTATRASASDSATWLTFDAAVESFCGSSGQFDGVGFVFTSNDPFCGIDLDECIGHDGSFAPEAQAIIDSFESYTEVSPSGRGVKIFIIGRKPESANCRSKAIPGFKETEVYDTGANEDREKRSLVRFWRERRGRGPPARTSGDAWTASCWSR